MQGCLYDYSIDDFLRNENETDDSKRLQRAIDACEDGRVLYIPRGTYEIASPVKITNGCSLLMHKSTDLKAVAKMDFVVSYDSPDSIRKDFNIF